MGYRVAVVGATGNVGREILNILVERELALGEDVQDFAPDIARRPDDRDPITHMLRFPSLEWRRSGLGAADCQRDQNCHYPAAT
jgi:uncharacterized protein YbjT (DUF2867 family)